MDKFETLSAVAAPLLRANIDTDAIIPSREMNAVSKTGLADGLFAGWRYLRIGSREPNPEFVLNDPRYAGARILLGGENFGCGSSREHAVWALREYGIRAIIAPSFAPIFYSNCVRNGIVPVRLPAPAVTEIAARIAACPAAPPVAVDLAAQRVTVATAQYPFDIDSEAKHMLLEGLDEISLTLKHQQDIEAFLREDRLRRPWIYLKQAQGGQ